MGVMPVEKTSKIMLKFLLGVLLLHQGLSHYQHDVPWQEYHEMDCCPQPPPPPPPLPPDFHHGWVTGFMETNSLQPRLRVGNGDYAMLHDGAELCCYFPPNFVLLSNIVWEKLKRGEESRNGDWLQAGQKYSLRNIQGGSTLRLYDLTYLDRGIYRCLATGLDAEAGRTATIFQDVFFYPS